MMGVDVAAYSGGVDRIRCMAAAYRRWEARHARRLRRWPLAVRWIVLVGLPALLICAAGAPLAWIGGITAEASRGAASPADAVFRYLDGLSYDTEAGLLPVLNDGRGDKLLKQWRAYRSQMQRGGTQPSKLECSVEATSSGAGGRVVVNAAVQPVWWATDGRGLSFKGAGHTWVFVTRDDNGWQIENVEPYPWCGGHVTEQTCRR